MKSINEAAERERFEQAMGPHKFDYTLARDSWDRAIYKAPHVESIFYGWQLRDREARSTLPQTSGEAVKLDPVVEANRALLHQRSQVGVRKYGVTLGNANLSEQALLQHALEEALDLANYLQANLQRVAAQRAEPAPEMQASHGAVVGTDADVMRGIMRRYDEFMADTTAQAFGTPFKAWAAAKYPAEYMANRAFLSTPASADSAADARDAWISVEDRLPEVGIGVMVYSPPLTGEGPEDFRLDFDCIDPNDDDHASWLNHNESYEHFCCVAKPEGSTGPKEKAPYTHWQPLPPPPAIQAQAGDAPMGGV